jgi:hypothetical protein
VATRNTAHNTCEVGGHEMTKFRELPEKSVSISQYLRKDGSAERVQLLATDGNEHNWDVRSDDIIKITKTVSETQYYLFMFPDEWELVKDMVETAEGMIERRTSDD